MYTRLPDLEPFVPIRPNRAQASRTGHCIRVAALGVLLVAAVTVAVVIGRAGGRRGHGTVLAFEDLTTETNAGGGGCEYPDCICPCTANPKQNSISGYAQVPLHDMNLNRWAHKLEAAEREHLKESHYAFKWNSGDQATKKWRPQGIATIASGGKDFTAVTWYGRRDESYENRGARVSFVDANGEADSGYRHVLLVDAEGRGFCDLHAGGLVYRQGLLHVPDSRNRNSYGVYTFSIHNIREVPAADQGHFYNYRYIIQQAGFYQLPLKPSFMAFDWSRNQVVVGSFQHCGPSQHVECWGMPNNKLAWYSIGATSNNPSAPYQNYHELNHGLSEMQGVVSDGDSVYVSCSYGRSQDSHLHVFKMKPHWSPENSTSLQEDFLSFNTIIYPPGLEDLQTSYSSTNIWQLTEWGTQENSGGTDNERIVFATQRERLQPPTPEV